MTAVRQRSTVGFVSVNDYGASQGAGNSTTAVTNAQAALVAGGGGILWFPPGVTYLDLNSFAVPSTVHWLGAGKGSTIVHWNTDQGVGTKALICGGDNTTSVSFENMTLEGPGNVPGVGVKPCNMSGVQMGSKNWMRNCIVRNWNIGVILNADHNLFDNCLFTNCYWGNSYPESGWDAKGDQSYWYCDFTGCNLAGIHVAGSQTLDHVEIRHTHFGFGPYGILREDYANGTVADAGFLFNVGINGGAFEYIGNSCIADRSTGAVPGGLPSWLHCTIDNTGYTPNGAFKTVVNDLHGTPYDDNYIIDLPGVCRGGYIRNNWYQFNDGTLGTYRFGSKQMQIIDGGGSGNPPAKMFAEAGHTWFDPYGDTYQSFLSSGTIVAGDLVELTTTADTVRRATGVIGTSPVIGNAYTGSAANTVVLIQVRTGRWGHYVNSETVSTAALPVAQVTGAYHTIGLASTYPSNPIIGYSLGATAGGQTQTRLNLSS